MRFFVFAVLILCQPLGCVFAQTAADSLLRSAQTKYDDGDFEGAELAALRGLREAASLDDLGKSRFHALLGFIYVARDQKDNALKEFQQVLAANPAYELDPVQTSPKIQDVFREAKRDYLLRVASEPAIYHLPQADVRLNASWRSLLLPGWGQRYKQQEVKGAAIIGAQVISLAALIFMQTEVNRRHDDYLAVKSYDDPTVGDKFNNYRRAYKTRNVFGYVTLGIYMLNYLDALYTPVERKK